MQFKSNHYFNIFNWLHLTYTLFKSYIVSTLYLKYKQYRYKNNARNSNNFRKLLKPYLLYQFMLSLPLLAYNSAYVARLHNLMKYGCSEKQWTMHKQRPGCSLSRPLQTFSGQNLCNPTHKQFQVLNSILSKFVLVQNLQFCRKAIQILTFTLDAKVKYIQLAYVNNKHAKDIKISLTVYATCAATGHVPGLVARAKHDANNNELPLMKRFNEASIKM